jgi:PAS domain S-box-containing protein
MILRYLSDGTITYANDAFCNYIDKSIDLLIGSSLLSLIHEDDRERAADFLESVTANKLPIFKGAVRIITSQGETRWLEQTSKPILGKHGEIVEFQVIGRDATTQIETGEAILGVPGETSSIVEGGCV